MPRRKAAPKRVILPDPLFHSEILAKFMNVVMSHGKKSVAEKIVYGSLDFVVKNLPGIAKQIEDQDSDGGESGGGSSLFTQSISGDIRTNEKAREVALAAFKRALKNITPVVEVKSRRVGGATYQVPVEIRSNRRVALAMRWLAEYAGARNEKTMVIRLGKEMLDALLSRGGAVKKREDVHRMAKANQAFSHYRW